MFLLTQISAIIEYFHLSKCGYIYAPLGGGTNLSYCTGLVKLYLLHKLYKLEEVIVLQKLNKTFIL